MKNTVFPHKFWRPFLDCTPQLFFRPQYVWFPVHLKGHLIPLCYETLVVNWQNWLFTLFHQSRSVLSPNPIIRPSSCYESDSRYTKHYQQFWRYHNHISGLMPLTNSYLTTILVHMLWHSGELHLLAPLALLLTMFPSSYHHEIFRSYYQWPK